MYGFISKLIMSGKLNFKEGQISLLGQPMVIVPADFYVEATRHIIENRDKKEMMDLYLDAWEAGVCFMRDISQAYKMKKFEERYKISMDIISMAGFGDYQTLAFEKGVHTHFKIMNNSLALKLRPSKKPVCHILRGFNAGGSTIVHEKIFNCIETECAAVNGHYCIHIDGITGFISKKDKKLVNEQLDLKWLLPKQKKFMKGIDPKIKA